MLYQALTTMNPDLGKENGKDIMECRRALASPPVNRDSPFSDGFSGTDPAAVANLVVFRGPDGAPP